MATNLCADTVGWNVVSGGANAGGVTCDGAGICQSVQNLRVLRVLGVPNADGTCSSGEILSLGASPVDFSPLQYWWVGTMLIVWAVGFLSGLKR